MKKAVLVRGAGMPVRFRTPHARFNEWPVNNLLLTLTLQVHLYKVAFQDDEL